MVKTSELRYREPFKFTGLDVLAEKFEVPVEWVQNAIGRLRLKDDSNLEERLAKQLEYQKRWKGSPYYQMKYPPVETVYKGITFKSRTEAKWAVFFDALYLRWQYNGRFYLPKFDCYININKPADKGINSICFFSTPLKYTGSGYWHGEYTKSIVFMRKEHIELGIGELDTKNFTGALNKVKWAKF
jgi:hypothetical protein